MLDDDQLYISALKCSRTKSILYKCIVKKEALNHLSWQREHKNTQSLVSSFARRDHVNR